MRPENVNPKNFKVDRIIYNQDGFSIAIGVWQDDNSRRFAMRWNGESEEDKGYPSLFANPMWFQLTDDINGVVNALLENCNVSINETT